MLSPAAQLSETVVKLRASSNSLIRGFSLISVIIPLRVISNYISILCDIKLTGV